MKNYLSFLVIIMLVTAGAARGDLIIASSTNAPAAIPDNNSLGLQQTINVSGYDELVTIESLTISLNIAGIHGGAFNGDFYVTLQHDTGYAVLLNRVGVTGSNPFGYADNGFNITFVDGGNDVHLYQNFSPTYSAGALTGNWGVDGRAVDPALVTDASSRTTGLNSFTNASPNGTWTLFVADVSQGGQGQLNSWSVNMTVVPEPAALPLMLLGALGLRTIARRRKST